MIKKLLSFTIVITLFVLTSCGTFASPQKSYAAEMEPAVELLGKWQSTFSELDTLLTEQLDPATGITRLQLIELYNIGTEEYQISRDEYSTLGLNSLDALVAPSVGISKDGQRILDLLSTAKPVEEIQPDHQSLLDCVRARVAFADELSSSIKELSSIDMNKAGDLVACDSFDASLEKITTFVNENK